MGIKEMRIPTVAALAVLLFTAAAGALLSDNVSTIIGNARERLAVSPDNVNVTNVTDSSLVISWTTIEPTIGYVRYKQEDGAISTAYDIRDDETSQSEYAVHYVPLYSLKHTGSVAYEIVVNTISFPQAVKPLGAVLGPPPQVLPIYGTLQTERKEQTTGSIVYVQIGRSMLYSTFVGGTDNWIAPIAAIRSNDAADYYCNENPCGDETEVVLHFVSEEGNSTSFATLSESRPLTPIILGMKYRAVASNSSTKTHTSEGNLLGTSDEQDGIEPTPVAHRGNIDKVMILSPKKDVSLTFPKPLIRGLGIPGEIVIVMLKSDTEQVETISVGEDGTWLWTPPLPLKPGTHTITIKTKDKNGKLVVLTRDFVILKSGEQVLSSSTPSATAIPTEEPSPTILTSPTILPTAPSFPTPTPPVSASFIPSVFFVGGGVTLLLLGLTLL